MNRIFHARVPWYTLFFLFLLLVLTVWAYWERLGLVALFSLLLMVILIERTIHTTYTITTDGLLVIHRGRFSKELTIPLMDIRRIEQLRSACFGQFSLTNYIIVYYGQEEEKSVSLIPANGHELVAYIQKIRKK